MEDILLAELIDSMQYDMVHECMKILKINVSHYKEKEYEYTSPYHIELKDIYAQIIIEETEKKLSEEQKKVFYQGININYIKYTNNEELKKKIINDDIENGKAFNYSGEVFSYITDLISSLETDDYKLDFINKYKNKIHANDFAKILCTLKDDNKKLEFINDFLEEPYEFGSILLSLHNDDLKLSLYEKYKEELYLDEVLDNKSLIYSLKRDDLKLKVLEENGYNSRLISSLKMIYGLTEEENLLSIWDKLDIKGKALVIYRIKDPNKKFELFTKLNEYLATISDNKIIFDISYLITELPKDKILYLIKEYKNIKLGRLDLIRISNSLDNEEEILELLKISGSKEFSKHVRNNRLLSSDLILANLDLFLEIEHAEDRETIKKHINYLYPTNNDILYTITWDILKPKYIETLGLDKINVIASFKELIECLLNMTDKEYNVFYHVLDYYIEMEGITDWQYAAYQIMEEIHLNKVDKKELCNYIDDIDNVNMSNLLYILLNGDNFGVKSLDDINNYKEKQKEKYDNLIINGSLSEKKDAIFVKFFGLSDYTNMLNAIRQHTKNGMGRIYNIYHEDIDLIENEDLKQLFRFVETIIKSESEEELINIYNNKKNFEHLDTYKLERLLKNEYLKLYNKKLLQLDGLPKNEDGLYEAGDNFSIITTSVGAYVTNNPDDYQASWNRPSLASQHFCASYIRNDMLGTAPVPHIMYGFTSMEPYSLLLSGSTDIYSSGATFISKAYNGEKYLGPDRQINETAYNKKHRYNEMDFRRIQNGQKKKPDYILVFRRDGVIPNIEKAKKASQDWHNLPIVVVDIDLCLKNEKELTENMLIEYYQNPTNELFDRIKTKIMNNRVTDSNFLANVNLDELQTHIVSEIANKRNL